MVLGASETGFVRMPLPGTGWGIWQPYGKPAPVLSVGKIAKNNIGNLTRTFINTTSPVRLPTKQRVTPNWQPYEQKHNLITNNQRRQKHKQRRLIS